MIIETQFSFLLLLVFLITGGLKGEKKLKSVEIFDPRASNISLSCSLPDMTLERFAHASVGKTVCGGNPNDDGKTSCETLDPSTGLWSKSHSLQQSRYEHVMWRTPADQMIVIGGLDQNSSEILRDDGFSVSNFTLQHQHKIR